MIARTFGDVKDILRRTAGQSGLRVDDNRLKEIVNLAQETLLSKVVAPVGTYHRLKFCAYDQTVALPARYIRLVKGSVARANSPVMGQWRPCSARR